jgi:hypothetical protein
MVWPWIGSRGFQYNDDGEKKNRSDRQRKRDRVRAMRGRKTNVKRLMKAKKS